MINVRDIYKLQKDSELAKQGIIDNTTAIGTKAESDHIHDNKVEVVAGSSLITTEKLALIDTNAADILTKAEADHTHEGLGCDAPFIKDWGSISPATSPIEIVVDLVKSNVFDPDEEWISIIIANADGMTDPQCILINVSKLKPNGGGDIHKVYSDTYVEGAPSVAFVTGSVTEHARGGLNWGLNILDKFIYHTNETKNLLISYGADPLKLRSYVETNTIIPVHQANANNSGIMEYVGVNSQLVVNVDDNSIHVMDATTKGGHKVAMQSVTYTKTEVDAAIASSGGSSSTTIHNFPIVVADWTAIVDSNLKEYTLTHNLATSNTKMFVQMYNDKESVTLDYTIIDDNSFKIITDEAAIITVVIMKFV